MPVSSRRSPQDHVSGPALAGLAEPVHDALAAVRSWVDGPLAVVLGGSHASGEAVWIALGGRRVCLSDLDVYVLAPDLAARRAAERRAAAAFPALRTRLAAGGLAAPLEVGFLTPSEWLALPARPGTIELRRHGLLFDGDPEWLERLPNWTARDVDAEEVLLLLENRAFELIAARWAADPGDALARARARHATLKTALDLAGVERLRAAAWEDGAEARVAAARRARPRPADAEPPWDEALAWRRGAAPAGGEELEWWRTAAAWVGAWAEAVSGDPRADFAGVARRAARRARLRRRLRLAVRFECRSGRAPSLAGRLAHAFAGTPQHRLDASAAAMLAAACVARVPAAAPAALAGRDAVLRELGAVRPTRDDRALAWQLLEAWDQWVLEGRRFPEPA